MRAVLRTVITLSLFPNGFTSAQLAKCVAALLGQSYSPRQAAYDLKKLRAKKLVGFSRRRPYYEPTREGLRTVTALLVLRDNVIKPILAGAVRPRRGRPPKNRTVIDEHYERLQLQMGELLDELRLAA